MPDSRDAHALAALVLLHDSRRSTRVDGDGALVPLDEQDRGRWDRGRIANGVQRLQLAAGADGPYLPQAVIAAIHATAPSWEQTDWPTICAAYDRLLQIADSPIVRANRALAIGFRDGFPAGLAALDECGRRSAAGAIEHRAVDTGRPAAAGRPQVRGRRVVREGVGPSRVPTRPGPSWPAAYGVFRLTASCAVRSAGRRGSAWLTSAPGPSKCHHSPEYTVSPPAAIPSRSHFRLACCSAVTPSVAKAFALAEKSSKPVPMSIGHP